MAKMNLPALEQLDLIEQRCNEIEEKYPNRRAAYQPSFTNFDSELRQGIVMYRPGWGWRLRKDWRLMLNKKRLELKTTSVRLNLEKHFIGAQNTRR